MSSILYMAGGFAVAIAVYTSIIDGWLYYMGIWHSAMTLWGLG